MIVAIVFVIGFIMVIIIIVIIVQWSSTFIITASFLMIQLLWLMIQLLFLFHFELVFSLLWIALLIFQLLLIMILVRPTLFQFIERFQLISIAIWLIIIDNVHWIVLWMALLSYGFIIGCLSHGSG